MTIAALPMLTGCVVAATSRSGTGGGGLFFLFLPLLVFLFIVSRASRASRTSRIRGGSRRSRFAEVPEHRSVDEVSPQMLRAELSVLADDVLRLEPQVALREEARD